MVERYRPPEVVPVEPANIYWDRKEVTFLNTGCTLLDCIIGGGWPFGRIVNIVGDRSTGKTLLAEEAMANCQRLFPKGKICYRESEAAFDASYAEALGINTESVDFGPDGPDSRWSTIEDIAEDLSKQLDAFDKSIEARVKALRERNKRLLASDAEKMALAAAPPGLYIIDSLDAVTSEAERSRDIREGSYNLEKQKLFGELMRKETRRLWRAKKCLMVISQTRQRIGPMIMGKKYRRHCEDPLNFYSSAVVYLRDVGKVYETVKGIKRPVAIKIKAKCDKNKLTMPYRECAFEIRFGYGMDDEWASLDWLKEVKHLPDAGFAELPKNLDHVDIAKLQRDTRRIWHEVESSFKPPKGKYAA